MNHCVSFSTSFRVEYTIFSAARCSHPGRYWRTFVFFWLGIRPPGHIRISKRNNDVRLEACTLHTVMTGAQDGCVWIQLLCLYSLFISLKST